MFMVESHKFCDVSYFNFALFLYPVITCLILCYNSPKLCICIFTFKFVFVSFVLLFCITCTFILRFSIY